MRTNDVDSLADVIGSCSSAHSIGRFQGVFIPVAPSIVIFHSVLFPTEVGKIIWPTGASSVAVFRVGFFGLQLCLCLPKVLISTCNHREMMMMMIDVYGHIRANGRLNGPSDLQR